MAKQSALKVPTGLSPEKQAKVDAILKKYEEQNRQIEREHAKEMAKLYGGAALQIGSAFIPGTLGLKLAGGAIKGLAPVVGRKIAQNVATGVTSGLASGLLLLAKNLLNMLLLLFHLGIFLLTYALILHRLYLFQY